MYCSSHAAPGPGSWNCGHGWRSFEATTAQGQDVDARHKAGHDELSNRGLIGDLFSRKPPAGAGNVLWCGVDMFFEAHQFPVAGARHKDEAGFARNPDHRLVGSRRLLQEAVGPAGSGASFQIPKWRRADAVSLPAVVDRQAELEA